MKTYTIGYDVTAAPAAAERNVNKSGSILKLGLDIHREKFVVVAQHDHATPRPPQRFAPAEFVPWVKARLREEWDVHVVYEACGFGFGLCRALSAAQAHCYVIAPADLDEHHTRVKTDGRDARTLCLRLDRYLQGNHDALAVIRVPSETEERDRHWTRQREQLVRHRKKLQAQGRGLLIGHELPAPAHWWKQRTWKTLSSLLPAWALAHLELYRPTLLTLEEQIKSLTAQLEDAATGELPQGIGKLTSVILSREICDWKRFHNRRQISSYTGLCPGEYSSGDKRLQGRVTKHGNPRLRAALVELAWRMVRFQPNYPPVRERLAVVAKGARATSAQRKKAIVAIARRLAVDLWRLHTGQCSAAALGLEN